jgi:beta-1,4-N-acetylglucosaminyltransferase
VILVTVGLHQAGFERLVRAMDAYAAASHERVVIQRGSAAYRPRHADHFRFAPPDRMAALSQEARVIVAHAAAGTAVLALRLGKPLVLVPRRQAFGEHLDDHQQELAHALAAGGRAVVVDHPAPWTLRQAVVAAACLPPAGGDPTPLLAALRELLAGWERTPA